MKENKVESEFETKSENILKNNEDKNSKDEQMNVEKTQQNMGTEKQEVDKDKEIKEPEIEKCTNNNNHGIEVGNSGMWFNTKEEAVAYYDEKIAYWGNLWENFEIDDETYRKNCPYRI